MPAAGEPFDEERPTEPFEIVEESVPAAEVPFDEDRPTEPVEIVEEIVPAATPEPIALSEVDEEDEDAIFTSVGSLNELYSELENQGAGGASYEPEVPAYEASGGGDDESFDFELDPGETGEHASVEDAINKEREAVLSSAEYSHAISHRDEAFEVTLDDYKPDPPPAEESTEAAFGELALEDTPTPAPPAQDEPRPRGEPAVSAGSQADWLELEYPEDAASGHYEMAEGDDPVAASDFDEAYANIEITDPSAKQEPAVRPDDQFDLEIETEPRATLDLFDGDSGELEHVHHQVSSGRDGGDADIFSNTREITPVSLDSPTRSAESGAYKIDVGEREPSVADSVSDLVEAESTSELEAVPSQEELPVEPRRPIPRPRSISGRVIRSRGPSGYFQRVDTMDGETVPPGLQADTPPPADLTPADRAGAAETRPTVRQKQPPIPPRPRGKPQRTPARQTPPPRPGLPTPPAQDAGTELNIEATTGQKAHDGRATGPSALSFPFGGGQSGTAGQREGGKQRAPTRPREADIPRTPSGSYPVAPSRKKQPPGPPRSRERRPSSNNPPLVGSSPQRFTAPSRRRSQSSGVGHKRAAPPAQGQPSNPRSTGTWRQGGGGPEPTMRRSSPAIQQPPPSQPPPQRGAPGPHGVQVSKNVVIGQGRRPADRKAGAQQGGRGPQGKEQQWPNRQSGSIQSRPPSHAPAESTPTPAGAGGERTLDEVILDYLHGPDGDKEK